MEKRVVLAVVLTVAVIFLTNVLFPPVRSPTGPGPAETDSLVRGPQVEAGARELAAVTEPSFVVDSVETGILAGAPPVQGDTIVVRSDLYELHFSTLGASLISARLFEYESYSVRANGDDRVELVRPGDRLFGYRVAAGGDTASLGDRLFTADRLEITLGEQTESDSLRLSYEFPGSTIRFVVVYRFRPDTYLVEVAFKSQDRKLATRTLRGRNTHSFWPFMPPTIT